jgi:hypothetical protein
MRMTHRRPTATVESNRVCTGRRVASLFCGILLILVSGPISAAQLNSGQYIGSLQMEGSRQKIAISLDAYNTQINDPATFPKLNATLRVNLGGYFSPEYVAYHFYNPQFNFEQSILQLDDTVNELTATLKVSNTESQTIIEGPVVYRPTQAKGFLRVTLDADGANIVDVPFLSTLSGEYLGTCGKRRANLQIETGRGLGVNQPDNALANYMITGRLGYEDQSICGNTVSRRTIPSGQNLKEASYCQAYPFSSGVYYLYDDKLSLQGALGTVECKRDGETLNCTLSGTAGQESCTLTKKAVQSTPALQAPSLFYLKIPTEQMKPLPDPAPPSNTELTLALQGEYFGFLHYENQDKFQLISMNVVATTSTENPHIQNQVLIAPTVSMLFGSSWGASAPYSVRLVQRVFYLSPGFALQGPNADDFLVVKDWRLGYVRGVWYSRSYGRVGTFEFQKQTPPSVDKNMKVVGALDGQFLGPKDAPLGMRNQWWLQLRAPGQVARANQSVVSLLGQFKLAGNITQTFSSANYDLYTGTTFLLIHKSEGERILRGSFVDESHLNLLWPVGPAFEAPMQNYEFYSYERVTAAPIGVKNGK